MSRRIEIELTSQRSPEEWTWRAAGAKQPKGVLATAVLYDGAKVGDVAKAEIEVEIDGITVTQVSPPFAKRAEKAQRIDVVGTRRDDKLVTSQLVEKKDRPRRSGPRRDGDGPRSGGRDGEARTPRSDRPRRDSRERTPGGPERPSGDRRPNRERPARPARPEAPTFKKLTPKDDARRAVLEELPPEHRPIAEQVLRGGIPAVRQAIELENTKAKAEDRPELNRDALLAMAEDLMPKLKAADWMDRATAAKAQVDEISVRDLRTVVSGADAVARTDEARLLAAELREALDRRTNAERDAWVKEIGESLEGGRVVRALRLAARPPDAQTKFPPELLAKLKSGAEESMSPETAPDRWITLLDAVGNSPVRRSVEPKGLPETPGDELLSAAKAAAGRIPALAKMLGVTMPPPPPVRKPLPPKPIKSEGSTGPSTKGGDSSPTESKSEPPARGAPEPVLSPAEAAAKEVPPVS